MNRLRQPSFYHVGSTRRIAGALVTTAAVVLAGMCQPDASAPVLAHAAIAASRIAVDALSILLAAGPYVFAGALCASLIARFAPGGAIAAALVTALAPGCDCSMNGFAPALRRCPAPLAGAALVWGAACNPVALAATMSILGGHALRARVAGGLVAAALVAFTWWCFRCATPLQPAPDRCEHPACAHDAPARGAHDVHDRAAYVLEDLCARAEAAIRSLLPAALITAILIVALPAALRVSASPWSAAALGALLSPCSSADPMLARVFATSPSAQAAFVIAGQCLDLRFTMLLVRAHGVSRALVAWLSGAIACATAAALA